MEKIKWFSNQRNPKLLDSRHQESTQMIKTSGGLKKSNSLKNQVAQEYALALSVSVSQWHSFLPC